MEHYKTMTGRHLTLKQRNLIQEGLYNGLNFSQIAKFICKDPTTVSKEVKRNRKRWVTTFNKSAKFSVKCVHSTECRKKQ
jgi:IS30 family transposase